MSQELAYVIITPYTLYKSRTGGILARLITRTGMELVGARMFAPSNELVQEYSKAVVSANDPQDRRIQELIRDYILQKRVSFRPVIDTPFGPTKVEIRIMYILDGELRTVNTIVRMGRGSQMGVDHNRGLEWVGASAGFISK